jgi:hypothetical protein
VRGDTECGCGEDGRSESTAEADIRQNGTGHQSVAVLAGPLQLNSLISLTFS